MYFEMAIIMMFVGITFGSICGFIGGYIPMEFKAICFFLGLMFPIIGIILLYLRCLKTGVIHLINPGRPDLINWLYIYADGELKILPSIRKGEGFLYSPNIDAVIPDAKTYSLCDHRIRIVPERLGHAIDTNKVLYAQFLRTKFGYTNLREARNHWLNKIGLKKFKTVPCKEATIDAEDIVENG